MLDLERHDAEEPDPAGDVSIDAAAFEPDAGTRGQSLQDRLDCVAPGDGESGELRERIRAAAGEPGEKAPAVVVEPSGVAASPAISAWIARKRRRRVIGVLRQIAAWMVTILFIGAIVGASAIALTRLRI